jgi:hypothetical protein
VTARTFSRVAFALLAAAQLGANCVDGVTPDCSDPAVCAPSQGDLGEGGPLPEASTDAKTGGPDAARSSDAADASDARDARDGG